LRGRDTSISPPIHLMLSFKNFDLKTGKILQDYDLEGTKVDRVTEEGGMYLEAWLEAHKIEPQGLYVANFYKGVGDGDRRRLENNGKELIFTNGKKGYFADRQTAKLIAEGDTERGIEPIYANSQRAAHNAVAYGSLPVSDSQQAYLAGATRILIVDNERRFAGNAPLVDRDGKKIPLEDLEKLFDKMGDGTMLVEREFAKKLLTETEIRKDIERGLGERNDSDLAASIFNEFAATNSVSSALVGEDIAQKINKSIDRRADRTILQFRAATPNLPGIAKGTLTTSEWAERLGVSAIVSTDDIKGDDGRLKQPGIQELDRGLWVARKSIARFGTQSVGIQVKGTIADATRDELNPLAIAKSREIAEIAGSNWQVAERFVRQKDKQQASNESKPPEPIHVIIKADTYGRLTNDPKISEVLKKSLRRERLDAATSGIEIPAATAQHHSQLEPWEICNRDLPHGAIVAYYRSPFPNVGAAGVAVNNLDILKNADPEAYQKEGAVYLNPWTAKNVAITDFDGDKSAIFVGVVDPSLPERLRNELSDRSAVGADRYELGRAALAVEIDRASPGTYYKTVKEFIDATAPDRKPLAITKAKKIDHPWHSGEDRTAAIWRAWEVTSDNPTGKVANLAMTQQRLAGELAHIEPDRAPQLLKEIGNKYVKIDPEIVPTDDYLESQGLPKLDLQATLDRTVTASRELDNIPPADRVTYAQEQLELVRNTIQTFADSATAKNLQTAVDIVKNAQGIDESLHEIGMKLAYSYSPLKKEIEDPYTYILRELKDSIRDPIGAAIDAANQIYRESDNIDIIETSAINKRIVTLMPSIHTPEDTAKVDAYLNRYSVEFDRFKQVSNRLGAELPADSQPTITIVSTSGKKIAIERTLEADPNGDSPIWDREGIYTGKVVIAPAPEAKDGYMAYTMPAVVGEALQPIGYVSPGSAEELPSLTPNLRLKIENPTVAFEPAFKLQNDDKILNKNINQVMKDLKATAIAEGREAEFASAAWRMQRKQGRNIAIDLFPQQVVAILEREPEFIANDLTPAARELANGERVAIRFERDLKISLLAADGSTKPLGAIDMDDNGFVDPGIVIEATIERTFSKGEKIRIDTELGEFIVNPSPNIVSGVVAPHAGEFTFVQDGKKTLVYLQQSQERVQLGELGKEGANKQPKSKLGAVTTIPGTMGRDYDPNLLKIQTIGRLDRHDVRAMDRGELIPLPERSSDPSNSKPDCQASTYNPTLAELRRIFKERMGNEDRAGAEEIRTLGVALARLHPYPWDAPDSFNHPNVTLEDSRERYYPSIGELRDLYFQKSQAQDNAGRERVGQLGVALAKSYQGSDKAPDDFTSPAVWILAADKASLYATDQIISFDRQETDKLNAGLSR
jgi:hypothetical protein